MRHLPGCRTLLFLLFVAVSAGRMAAQDGDATETAAVRAAPVPPEMRSGFFAVTVDNQRVDVAHAASNYEFVSFDTTGQAEITITAADPHFWDAGVDIEPWRLGLRATHPQGEPQTIRFRLPGSVKLSISRPGDFLNQARMLFVFAGTPTVPAPTGANVTIVPAGVHRESLNPKSGDTIYLAQGAFVFGSLNLWQVENVKVLGRGTIVYEGTQALEDDQGWMQKPDWHCIEAYQAHNVEVDGLTCIVRSRTWSIQMKDSTGFRYDDLRVIGGNPPNANQDGMDWLGGGDTVVNDAFLRASDDDLAMEGNWDGYGDADMLRPGSDVNNIVVENSELSTSISNAVRIAWPRKTFNSSHFTLRNSDILHAGIGACGQTFGLLGLWGANGAKGEHSNITFENLFLDNWYSLVQMEQEQPALHGFVFRNIWALDQPPLAESTITGSVQDVTFDNVRYGQTRVTTDAQMPLVISGGADEPHFAPAPALAAEFRVDPSVFAPGQTVTLTAKTVRGAHYAWLFGDGSEAHGRRVRHRFPDALGTELDPKNGAGRFRVLLHVTDDAGHQDWAAQGVVAVSHWHDAVKAPGPTTPGLGWKIYSGVWNAMPDFSALLPVLTGESPSLGADAQALTSYATVWDGFIQIPTDGGYTFHLIDRDGARLMIDGVEVARTGAPFAQVCGSPGNALRYDRGAIGLRAGLHTIHVEALNTASEGAPRVMWEGPGVSLGDVPPGAYSHTSPSMVSLK
ncbi:MAG: PKD domain-containing protein [Terracidiphilus sp.]